MDIDGDSTSETAYETKLLKGRIQQSPSSFGHGVRRERRSMITTPAFVPTDQR